jgi:hypothetical protein
MVTGGAPEAVQPASVTMVRFVQGPTVPVVDRPSYRKYNAT